MSAALFDLNIEAGATFKLVLSVKDGVGEAASALDLTGWEVRMQVRKQAGALGLLLDCNATNGRVSVTNPAGGEITLNLPPADTSRIDGAGGVYDLVITKTATGETRRLLKGAVAVSAAVTK